MPGTGINTLANYATLSKEPLTKGIMLGLAMEGLVADIVPWESTGGALHQSGIRYDQVPTPDWIPLDGTISAKHVDGKPLSYTVYQMAHHIDVPRLLETQNANQLNRLSRQQIDMALKGASYELNEVFINGDQAANANQFNGINKLVDALDSTQRVGTTEIDISAGANGHELLDRLDRGWHSVEGHKPDAVFANSDFLLKFRSILRREKLLGDHYNWKEAAFDVDDPRKTLNTAATRPAFIYMDTPFYDVGDKPDSEGIPNTQIIGNTYSEGGSSAEATRVFLVKFGTKNLTGLQAEPLTTENIGLLEDKEVLRWRLRWTVGLANWGPRDLVKIQGIKVA